jgi:hypothetical protein
MTAQMGMQFLYPRTLGKPGEEELNRVYCYWFAVRRKKEVIGVWDDRFWPHFVNVTP